MNKKVLDSSAILAAFNSEPGADKVEFPNSLVSSVNVAEVFTKMAEVSQFDEQFLDDFYSLGLEIVDFNSKHAEKTAELRPLTRNLGLSLGDRSCLALAILSDATAVTADRTWKKIKFCPIETIR